MENSPEALVSDEVASDCFRGDRDGLKAMVLKLEWKGAVCCVVLKKKYE